MESTAEQHKNGVKPNKPGEPNFKLPIEPSGPIVFKREGKHCLATRVIENNTDKKVVFKVKVTNQKLFYVSKAVDILAAGAKINIRIYFRGTPEEASTRFVAFYHADIPEAAAAKKASEIWKEVQPAGVMRIHCVCESDEGKEKKEVKKEEGMNKEKKEEEKNDPAKGAKLEETHNDGNDLYEQCKSEKKNDDLLKELSPEEKAALLANAAYTHQSQSAKTFKCMDDGTAKRGKE